MWGWVGQVRALGYGAALAASTESHSLIFRAHALSMLSGVLDFVLTTGRDWSRREEAYETENPLALFIKQIHTFTSNILFEQRRCGLGCPSLYQVKWQEENENQPIYSYFSLLPELTGRSTW